MDKIRVMLIFGTRPEAIKMAPVVHELWSRPSKFEVLVVVTGQHREMLSQALDVFGISPSYDLQIMEPGQSLTQITTRILDSLDKVLLKETPDMVLVHGDTTTTFISALCAFYHKILVGHVEAGLRSHEKYQPFPEELNRKLTGTLADLHFAPTENARTNLLNEGISDESIIVTGNTVIDAVLAISRGNGEDSAFRFLDGGEFRLDMDEGRILLVEAHRRENWGEPMANICKAILEITGKIKDMVVVFPVHKNPVIRGTVLEYLAGKERIHLIEPPSYDLFISLLKKSYAVLTDSGGLQEEAPALAKPVLVLRDVTERPEVVQAQAAQLVGTCRKKIVEGVLQLFNNSETYEIMKNALNPYGDGQASMRIADAIEDFFRRKR
jgi:UDP-N-acetylglucosamine 2-epimerase (non-hydrolysing)